MSATTRKTSRILGGKEDMTKIEWLELANAAIATNQNDKAMRFINEVIELIKIEEKGKNE
jgi:hypothetical protein